MGSSSIRGSVAMKGMYRKGEWRIYSNKIEGGLLPSL